MHLHEDFLNELRAAFPKIEIIEGMPSVDDLQLLSSKERKLLVIDDQMQVAFNSKAILDLSTGGSHHANCSLIITTQNIFHKGKYTKTIMRQATEVALFFNKVDLNQARFHKSCARMKTVGHWS